MKTFSAKRKIEIYTDGACKGNGKESSVGGWGAYLSYPISETEIYTKKIYGGEKETTNNKMEIKAVIEGLMAITDKAIPITIYTDSAYVLNGITSWIHNWKKSGWKTAKGGEVKNVDLWVTLDSLVNEFKSIEFVKVKGHSGIEGNEIADKLAVRGAEEVE